MKTLFCFRLFAHAFVLQLALLLLAIMAPLCAQPVLQEWWRAPENMLVGQEIAYLPNFYMGKSAMAVMYNRRGVTWLNRFPGDTLDIFSWKGGVPICTGDFNGDGLTDYLDGSGYLYKGVKGDFAAEKEPSGRIFEGRPQTITVCDANHDGKDDILFSIGSDIGYCRGRNNFAEITRKVLTPPAVVKQGESRGTGTFYLGSDGDLRHIVDMSRQLGSISSLDSRDELEIYRYTWQAGDSVPKEIRKTGIIPGRKDRYMYSGYILVKPGSPGTDPDLYISTFTNANYTASIFQVWNIQKDEPQYLREFNKVGGGYLQFLTSTNENLFSPKWCIIKDTTLFFFDRPIDSATIPYCQYKSVFNDAYGGSIYAFASQANLIGDVNGDGYEDIAVGTATNAFPNVCRILLGIAPPAAHISQDTDALITLLAPVFPQPASDIIILQSRIEQSGLYTINLEPLAGGATYRVYQSTLDKGQTQLRIDCSTIPSGVYIITINGPTERLSTHLKVSIHH